jgi:Cu+-exporting ATPase
VLTVIKICFAVSIGYNLIGLGFAVTGQLAPVVSAILMPLSSLTVVGLAVGLTRLTAHWTLGIR